jgi:hypothetical protein
VPVSAKRTLRVSLNGTQAYAQRVRKDSGRMRVSRALGTGVPPNGGALLTRSVSVRPQAVPEGRRKVRKI